MPAPWTLPQCPKCKFVLYEEDAANLPIDKLKPYIQSKSFQSAAKAQPTYFCLGLIKEFLGATPREVGNAYLQASWQTDAKPGECRKYLELTFKHLSIALASMTPASDEFQTLTILCGEIERRLERFADARKRLEALQGQEAFKDLQEAIQRELSFIERKDSSPHAAGEKDEQYLKELE